MQPGLCWVVDYRNLGLQLEGCSKGAEVETPVHGCNPPCFWGVATQIYMYICWHLVTKMPQFLVHLVTMGRSMFFYLEYDTYFTHQLSIDAKLYT